MKISCPDVTCLNVHFNLQFNFNTIVRIQRNKISFVYFVTFQIANAHINLTRHPWDLNAENIFRYVDVFIGRCQDMIKICQAMIDFARSK